MLINTSANPLTLIATILASIGAINWGLIGGFNFNLVTAIFGEANGFTNFIYILVGASGLYLLLSLVKILILPSIEDID